MYILIFIFQLLIDIMYMYYVIVIDRKFISVGILWIILRQVLVYLIYKIYYNYGQFGGGIDVLKF